MEFLTILFYVFVPLEYLAFAFWFGQEHGRELERISNRSING
jgi:hypothetical protein